MLQAMVSMFQGSNLSHLFHMLERTYITRCPCSDRNHSWIPGWNLNTSPCSPSNSCAWSCTSGPIQRVQNRPPFSTKPTPRLSGGFDDDDVDGSGNNGHSQGFNDVEVEKSHMAGDLCEEKSRQKPDDIQVKSKWYPGKIQVKSRWNLGEIWLKMWRMRGDILAKFNACDAVAVKQWQVELYISRNKPAPKFSENQSKFWWFPFQTGVWGKKMGWTRW